MKQICFITLMVFLFAGCKKENLNPIAMAEKKSCCDHGARDTLFFAIQNIGSEPKTFRLFGGGTNQPVAEDNDYALDNGLIPVGDSPSWMAYNQDLNLIYVANDFDGTLSIIDSYSNEVIATLTTNVFASSALTYVSSNKFLYLADGSSNVVYAINTLTNTISPITVGNTPFAVFYSSALNKVYVANNSDNTVSIINPATNTVITTVGVGNSPTTFAYASSSGYLYVANSLDGTLSVINSSNNVLPGTISVGTNISVPYMLYVEILDKLYVSNTGDNTVSVVSPTLGAVSATISVGTTPVWLAHNSDMNVIYCSNEGDFTVSIINGLFNNVSAEIDLNGTMASSQTIYYNSINKYLYCVSTGDNKVQVFDTENSYSLIEAYEDDLATPYFIVFSNENTLYISNNGSDSVFWINSFIPVDVTVNGNMTAEEVNSDTLANPICICKMKIDGTSKNIYNTLLSKIRSDSNGLREEEQIDLLSLFSATRGLNNNMVEVQGKLFKTCVLDGFNYLQWTVPAGETIDIAIFYCQKRRSKDLQFKNEFGKMFEESSGPKKTKFTHGSFKYILK